MVVEKEQRETRLLAEWLARTYPGQRYATNVRLGLVPETFQGRALTVAERRAMGLWSRQADAVVFLPGATLIVEAAILAAPAKLGQLMVYREAFMSTEEFRDRLHLPLKLIIVSALEDLDTRALAERTGVEFHVYKPAWVDDFLEGISKRKAQAVGKSF